MSYLNTIACAVCGGGSPENRISFLLAENHWKDKVTILEWNEQIAGQERVVAACSLHHVEELVGHWMTTGSLDLSFPWRALGFEDCGGSVGRGDCVEFAGARSLAELIVHRESMDRIQAENPESLRTTLDALTEALKQETAESSDELSQGRQQPYLEVARAVSSDGRR